MKTTVIMTTKWMRMMNDDETKWSDVKTLEKSNGKGVRKKSIEEGNRRKI